MTDVLVKKKTLANQISLKIKENQKVNQRGDSSKSCNTYLVIFFLAVTYRFGLVLYIICRVCISQYQLFNLWLSFLSGLPLLSAEALSRNAAINVNLVIKVNLKFNFYKNRS